MHKIVFFLGVLHAKKSKRLYTRGWKEAEHRMPGHASSVFGHEYVLLVCAIRYAFGFMGVRLSRKRCRRTG